MSDQNLRQLVSVSPANIAEFIDLMERIGSELSNDDGLKWFNFLYLSVTREIQDHPPAGGWRNPAWLNRLDIVFSGFYRAAITEALDGSAELPSSWDALFQARHRSDIDRIQFAVAGINAHINHDLALALLQTNGEMGIVPAKGSPENEDYEHVNDVLEVVMPKVLMTLAIGITGVVVQSTGKIGQLLAFWSVRAARDLAWDFAAHIATLNPPGRDFAVFAQDKVTGALGRALLLPI